MFGSLIGIDGSGDGDASPSRAQTFLFADLAGFTALTEAHGDDRAADLAEDFFGRLGSIAGRHGAEVIKTIGDAVLIRSPRADDAIALGLEVMNELSGTAEYPMVRIGMHTGDAVERSGDWFGTTLNIAARVSAIAGGDQMLVTKATKQAAGYMKGVRFDAFGEHQARNVRGRLTLFLARPLDKFEGASRVDPVCRMTIIDGRAAGSLDYEGQTFHFCSLACAETFAADPEAFA